MKPLALIAWEYGPMAFGALGVEIASRDWVVMIASAVECSLEE
jgi:hypothetical protein